MKLNELDVKTKEKIENIALSLLLVVIGSAIVFTLYVGL